MRFNIKKLEAAGFTIYADKDSIEISAPPMRESAWKALKDTLGQQLGDQGLQDYVLQAYLIALHRAQILEVAE